MTWQSVALVLSDAVRSSERETDDMMGKADKSLANYRSCMDCERA